MSFRTGGGSGIGSIANGAYAGNDTLVQPSTLTELTWDSLADGEDVLDRTNLAFPTVTEDGLYIAALFISPDENLDVGSAFQAEIRYDFPGRADTLTLTSAMTVQTGLLTPVLSITNAYKLSAGMQITAIAFHTSALAKNCFMTGNVVRIA